MLDKPNLKPPSHSDASKQLSEYKKMKAEKSSPERAKQEFSKLRNVLKNAVTNTKHQEKNDNGN